MDLSVRGNGLLTSAETGWPRVSERVYIAIYIAYLPVIIIAPLARLSVKIQTKRRLEIDDGILVLALCCSLAAWVTAWQMRDLTYLQMEMVLGMKLVTVKDINDMLVFHKWYNAATVLAWISVYAVKLSFMFFFRKLISQVRSLELYWAAIMTIMVPSALFSTFFSFWICTDFSDTYLESCSVSSMMHREEVYLYATTVLDIFTDMLLISIPIILLSKVRINLKRKVILGMALCLSIFMIVICIIRVTTSTLPNGIIDTPWLSLWHCIEVNTAILMVSLTAFRSLYRQGASPGQNTPLRISEHRLWSSLRSFRLSRGNQDPEQSNSDNRHALPTKPRKAVQFVRRGATQDEIDSQLSPLDRKSPYGSMVPSTPGSDRDVSLYHMHQWPERSRGKLEEEIARDENEEHDLGI